MTQQKNKNRHELQKLRVTNGMTARTKTISKKKDMNLYDLLIIKVQSLYDIEHVLIKALPVMAMKATDQDLKAAFRHHLDETRSHVARLGNIFSILGQKPKKLKVEAIRGLVKDAEWVMKNIHTKSARDAAMIGAAEYVEHYEMAGYQVAYEWSKKLGFDSIAEYLAQSLREEIGAADKLRELGVLDIDRKALPPSSGDMIDVDR